MNDILNEVRRGYILPAKKGFVLFQVTIGLIEDINDVIISAHNY